MKHVVKYDVYLDILLMVSIYVCNQILIVKKWTSNSKWDIWTRVYFGPGPIGTRDRGTRGPGPGDLGPGTRTRGPGPGDPDPGLFSRVP